MVGLLIIFPGFSSSLGRFSCDDIQFPLMIFLFSRLILLVFFISFGGWGVLVILIDGVTVWCYFYFLEMWM